jgi:hypothetical protein
VKDQAPKARIEGQKEVIAMTVIETTAGMGAYAGR